VPTPPRFGPLIRGILARTLSRRAVGLVTGIVGAAQLARRVDPGARLELEAVHFLLTGEGQKVFDNTIPFDTQYQLNATNNRKTSPDNLRMLIGTEYLYEAFYKSGGPNASDRPDDLIYKVVSLGGLRKRGALFGPKTQIGQVTAMAYGGFDGTTLAKASKTTGAVITVDGGNIAAALR
jgi:hypothetical protein